MGGNDGAELCELTRNFTQSVLQDIINKGAMGLYRDDGLIVLKKENSQKMDKMSKRMVSVLIS